ncbi:unnamed protein product [Allacma fusca]|uniref:Gustatory receptor n=1 Tax=Allacma fusca TaxID=39272 RepID=A0A8J2NX88_9HEXA|nr:unnamed protein product [Allacma fusca]
MMRAQRISHSSGLNNTKNHRRTNFKNPDKRFIGQPIFGFVRVNQPRFSPRTHTKDDLYSSLRLFLIFGKLIGLMSIQGLFQKDYKKLGLRKSTFSSIIGIMIILALGVNAGVGITAFRNTELLRMDQYAWSFAHFFYYSLGLFIFYHNYRHISKFVQIIYNWNKVHIYFTQPDAHLFRDVNLVATFIMASAIGENVFVNLRHVPLGAETGELLKSLNITAWELYFLRANKKWASLASYHHALSLYTFICDKLSLYAWNYTDVTIVIFARALYYKYQALYLEAEAVLLKGGSDVSKWLQLTTDFETMRELLDQVNNFISPLIFASYGVSIYFMCLMFHNSVNPYTNTTQVANIYAYWAVAHLVVRVFLVSVASARVSQWAHHITELIRRCPAEAYVMEVQRMDRYLNENVIGFTGLDCFTFTKPMILKVVGVIFSFEVVLLQALQLSLKKSSSCSPHK